MIKIISASLVTAIIMLFIQFYFTNVAEREVNLANFEKDTIQYRVDSLKSELFIREIELNRYQVAFEIFARRNPKAAEQYSNIISDETE
jgi:hypothetical protein